MWKKAYFDTRAKIEASGREARWEFDRKRLFERTDYMATICQDLYDILQVRRPSAGPLMLARVGRAGTCPPGRSLAFFSPLCPVIREIALPVNSQRMRCAVAGLRGGSGGLAKGEWCGEPPVRRPLRNTKPIGLPLIPTPLTKLLLKQHIFRNAVLIVRLVHAVSRKYTRSPFSPRTGIAENSRGPRGLD